MSLSTRKPSSDGTKNDTLREIHQLDLRIQKLEKELISFFTNKRHELHGEFSTIEEMGKSLLDCRKKEGVRIQSRLTKIRTLVNKFLEEIKNVKSTPQFVSMVKKIMEDIESSITEYKEMQRIEFENILRSELSLWQECTLLEKKIDAWEKGQDADAGEYHIGHPVGQLSGKMDVTKDLPYDVAEMERFLQQNGGRSGGWSELDHQTFLKFRQKHHGGRSFLREVVSALVVKTLDQVQEHENWYQEFLRLDTNKKEIIRRWKENKKAGIKQDNDQDFEDEEFTSARSGNTEWDRKRQELESKRAAVDAWRRERELEKMREKHEEERRVKEELEEKEREKLKRQEELRLRLAEYHQEKEAEEEEKFAMMIWKERKEKEELKRKIESSSTRIKDRNERFTDRKLQQKKIKDAESKEKELRLDRLKSQVEVLVPRDPSRLLQPTAGWRERVKSAGQADNGDKQNMNSAGILNMPHRAIPSWRQGLS